MRRWVRGSGGGCVSVCVSVLGGSSLLNYNLEVCSAVSGIRERDSIKTFFFSPELHI